MDAWTRLRLGVSSVCLSPDALQEGHRTCSSQKTYTKSKKLRSTRTTMSLRSSNRNDQAMTTPASTSMPTTTTRVCIKNLPLSFDEGKLKAHLQSSIASLILTDCKLLKTKDGRSRKIAFVGFKSPEVSDLHEVRRVFSYHLHKICSSRPIVLC